MRGEKGREERESGGDEGHTALLCLRPLSRQAWVGTHSPVTGVSKGRSQERQWKCAKSCL